MNKTIIFFLGIIFFTTNIFSQNPPPPPPPLIYEAPKKSELKEYRSYDNNFLAVFPGTPEVAEEDSDTSKTISYAVDKKGSLTQVRVYDFGETLDGNVDLDVFFDIFKKDMLSQKSLKLVEEIDIKVGNFDGKEFSFDGNLQYFKVRLIFAHNKIYELYIDVTNWHIIGDKVKAAYFAEANRFFDSFNFIKAAPGLATGNNLGKSGSDSKSKAVENSATNSSDIIALGGADADGWTKFSFPKRGFSIALPQKPQLETDQVDLGDFDTTMYLYSAVDDEQVFMTGVADFKFGYEDEAVLNELYDNWQEGFAEELPGGKLKSENITVKNLPARRISGKDRLSIEGVAVFSNGILYQMLVFTPPDKADLEELKSKSNKYFESFDLLKVENDSNSVKAEKNSDNFYKDSYFNFSLELPKSWYKISADGSKKLAEYSRNDPLVNEKGRKEFDKSFNRTEFLFHYVSKPLGAINNASFIAGVENIPTGVSIKQIATASETNFVKNMGYELVSGAKETELGGQKFMLIKLKKIVSPDLIIYQNLYMKRSRGLILQFMLSFTEDSELKLMEESLQTLKFEK